MLQEPLKEKDKEAYELREDSKFYLDHNRKRTFQEVADIMGISKGMAHRRYHRYKR